MPFLHLRAKRLEFIYSSFPASASFSRRMCSTCLNIIHHLSFSLSLHSLGTVASFNLFMFILFSSCVPITLSPSLPPHFSLPFFLSLNAPPPLPAFLFALVVPLLLLVFYFTLCHPPLPPFTPSPHVRPNSCSLSLPPVVFTALYLPFALGTFISFFFRNIALSVYQSISCVSFSGPRK